ncbi:ABC transporter substrate-binding protein [Nocardioides sp. LHG3406-4]|uniref:ABC transporter substrate-binding protein n=1 Tax=Nocardioides sp. LHG3406-4 TaxID=2804575 RepID=UPI003CF113F7
MATRRSWVTTGITVLTLGVLAGCSAGAGSSSSAGGDGEKDTVTVALNIGAPANLDFTKTDGAAIPQALLGNVYQGLVALNDDGEIVPALAESWDLSKDGKTYTFHLQPDVTFSDGADFTADDVKFSIERVKSDAWTISLKNKMDVVDKVEVVSPTEVAVTLANPSNDWLYNMATRVGAMFDSEGVDDLANSPIGTGPFEMSDFNRDTSITLTRRDDYWGDAPAVKTVTLKYFDDVNAQIAALQSGGLDVIYNIPDYNVIDQFKDDDELDIVEGTSTTKWVLSMNNETGLFADKRVRQAVNYAVDRDALRTAVANGYGELTGSMVPPTDPWFKDLSGDYPYDPEKAKQLLAEAGVSNASFDFDVPTLPAAVSAAQVVKSDLANIGITANIKTMEFPATWLDEVFTKADYDMSIIGHVESRDLAIYADPDYYFRYDSPEFQQLMKKGDTGTSEEQVEDYAAAMQLLSDDAVSDWLYLAANVSIVSSDLEGMPKNAISEGLDVSKLAWS